MPTTTNFALPYPASTDPANVPADMQALANKLDGLKLAAGTELGYDQITASVTVASGTEATGTTIIACAAHTFDGAPVIAHFFAPSLAPGDVIVVNLFEGSTNLGRLLGYQPIAGAGASAPGMGELRFTPTAGVHTYTVTAYRSSANGTINGGAGGAGALVPAFIRFTKV